MTARRLLLLAGIGFGVLAAFGSAVVTPRTMLVYNPTPSAPLGFYSVAPEQELHVGDMVVVTVPEAFEALATERNYIGAGVPLLKRIVALTGDEVCEHEGAVAVNGQLLAQALMTDGRGRAMPIWDGCRRLDEGEFFALMDRSPASFDGRYLGPMPVSLILGKARALWTF